LDRPMFKGGKMDPDEVGIMSILMGEDDDMGEDEDESDMAKLMDRRPDSPEILMNNLRGDVRSIDARFEELADMVGYDAAQQTPPEVLALLQPVLAAEQQGIAALPAMAPGAAPPPMAGPAGPPPPPPPMAGPAGPGMPPGAAPPPPEAAGIGSLPMGMARGGPVVQNFQVGSDEDGVEAEDSQPSASTAAADVGISSRLLNPAQREAAKNALLATLAPTKPSTRTMETRIADATKLYQGLLGQDKSLTQAQMLFDIAGAGLALAGNVDPRTGQPMRGSLASRIAGAASQLPAQIGARASEAEKMTQQIKLLGLQAAEKERESERAADLKREALKAQIGRDIFRGETAEAVANIRETRRAADAAEKAKAAGLTPARQNALLSNMELVNAYASGVPLTDPSIAALELSINQKYQQPPIVERYRDPDTDRMVERTLPRAQMPDYIAQAINARAKALGSRPTAQAPAATTTPSTTAPVTTGATAPAPAAPQATAPGAAPQAAATPVKTAKPALAELSFADIAGIATGPKAVVSSAVSRVPVVGGMVETDSSSAKTYIENTYPRLVATLNTTDILGQKVKNQLEERIALLPSFIDNQKDYLARLAAVDATLANYEEAALTLTSNEPVGSENRKRAQKDLQNIREVRSTLIKNRASTREEVMALPPGSWFLYLPTGRIEQRK
jgi:hypothetical protein